MSFSFEGFAGRKEALLKITRFDMYVPMFYRTNNFLHEKRVYRLLNEILPAAKKVFGDELNTEKILMLALVHDDAEIFTGDIQLGCKLKMSKEELDKIDEDEANAIEKIAEKWPAPIGGFSYKELLYHALRKDCLEAELVSYIDKMDAYCEALHELFAGNALFIEPVNVYTKVLKEFTQKFPRLAKLLPAEHSFLQLPKEFDVCKTAEEGKLHDEESIRKQTGLPHYDLWKQVTVNHFGLKPLIDVLENV